MNTVCLDFLSYLEKGDKPYQFYVLPFTNTLLHFRANYEARGSYLWTFIWKRVYSLGHNKISRNLYVPIQLYVDPQIEWPKESTLPNKRKISILRKSSCKNKWRRPFLLDLLPIRFFYYFHDLPGQLLIYTNLYIRHCKIFEYVDHQVFGNFSRVIRNHFRICNHEKIKTFWKKKKEKKE